MTLPLSKLTLIVGAGFVGSVLSQEGQISSVCKFFSNTLKIALMSLRQDDSSASSPKPNSDSLMQQVNSLRQELQLLASNRSVTIVTGNRSGSGKYGVVIIVVVGGYGYIRWKGWKLPDMMFATRRGLKDACASVATQLEGVYSSISATKKHLSSRIACVDCKIDECLKNTATTKDEVTELCSDVKLIGLDVRSVREVVQSLETKVTRIDGRQNETNYGVERLVCFVSNLEHSGVEQIEGPGSSSSTPALQLPPVSLARAVSLSSPTNALLESSSPSTSNGSHKRQATFLPPPSFGLKDLHELSQDARISNLSTPCRPNGSPASEELNCNNSSGAGVAERIFSIFGGGGGGSVVTRSRSVMQPFK